MWKIHKGNYLKEEVHMRNRWVFPSRGYGALEGYSNPGLEMFKGEPIRAMAREVCQNSLDAKKNNNLPLRIEFERIYMKVSDFPGMDDMRDVLMKCKKFWIQQNDGKTNEFIKNAIDAIAGEKFFVLRISDYNTLGLQGAFDNDEFNPWKSLVQGDAFSVKTSGSAAGSFGIGKAAPFVVSKLQTVFYRTYDAKEVRAAQGVTHLVSFEGEASVSGEDKIRRSTGYFGDGYENRAFKSIQQLDNICKRIEHGTDLFVPGFNFVTGHSTEWDDEIIIEILDNFLYAIYSGKLEVVVNKAFINKKTVEGYINRYLPKTKQAAAFFEVIREDNDAVIEEIKDFHKLGTLRLRLLYTPEANKKVLVVRHSGMKISDIPSLPRGISFTGFLELQGEELNKFFRRMENPQHNKWEHKRHSNPDKAKQFKEEVESWVRDFIGEKIKEISGLEMDIDVSAYFMASEKENSTPINDREKIENVVDSVKSISVQQDAPKPKNFKVKDIGGNQGQSSRSRMRSGKIDDVGEGFGHRKRTGTEMGGLPTGRKGVGQEQGEDFLYEQMREVDVNARIIKKSSGINKLIFTAEDIINKGELEIVTVGENGKPLQLVVKSVKGIDLDADVEAGHIVISGVEAKRKYSLEFEVYAIKTYAMGVKAYGN